MSAQAPALPVPDAKDWTWVLERACPDCGYDAAAVLPADLSRLTAAYAEAMVEALDEPGARDRAQPQVWSTLEYGCHVRDACRVFEQRLELMLTEDDPQFPNWDQDETARSGRYWEQAPSVVAVELAESADSLAARWATVQDAQWRRRGRRSDGSVFTVESLGRYFLHDLAHHAWDVRG